MDLQGFGMSDIIRRVFFFFWEPHVRTYQGNSPVLNDETTVPSYHDDSGDLEKWEDEQC